MTASLPPLPPQEPTIAPATPPIAPPPSQAPSILGLARDAYTRRQAAYPLPFVRARKTWPTVGRIDNPYGDRNLICACPPIESFAD